MPREGFTRIVQVFENKGIEMIMFLFVTILIVLALYLIVIKDFTHGALKDNVEIFNRNSFYGLCILLFAFCLVSYTGWAQPEALSAGQVKAFAQAARDRIWRANLPVGTVSGQVSLDPDHASEIKKLAEARVRVIESTATDIEFTPQRVEYTLERANHPIGWALPYYPRFYTLKTTIIGLSKWKTAGVEKTDTLPIRFTKSYTSEELESHLALRGFIVLQTASKAATEASSLDEFHYHSGAPGSLNP